MSKDVRVSEEVLTAVCEYIGVKDTVPANRGRRRKIREALEHTMPRIRAEVAEGIAREFDDEGLMGGEFGAEAIRHRHVYPHVGLDLRRDGDE